MVRGSGLWGGSSCLDPKEPTLFWFLILISVDESLKSRLFRVKVQLIGLRACLFFCTAACLVQGSRIDARLPLGVFQLRLP